MVSSTHLQASTASASCFKLCNSWPLNSSHLYIAYAISKAILLNFVCVKQRELFSMPANKQADREGISLLQHEETYDMNQQGICLSMCCTVFAG